jgi:hypothetical protein
VLASAPMKTKSAPAPRVRRDPERLSSITPPLQEILSRELSHPAADQHLPAFAHHGREVHRLPGEHVQLTQETAHQEDTYRPCPAREVVDHLYLALEDDYEVVLGVTHPEQDIPDLRLPLLPVAPENLDLVLPQRRCPRTTDLIHSIYHVATSSIALTTIASIMPPTAGRRILTIGHVSLAWASPLACKTSENLEEPAA